MSNYNKISLAQIDCDALADYTVAKKKLVYRSGDNVAASDKAQDVEKVAGVAANRIAVAAGTDRNTVQNALQLGGKPAADYMTNTQGSSIATKQLRMRALYGYDLQNLKDELYTLRQELAKKGFIEDRGEYTGYVDTFRAKAPKHISQKLATVTGNGNRDEIFVEDKDVFDSLNVYDFIVLEAEDIQKFTIRQIMAKEQTRKVLTLDSEIRNDIYTTANGMNLYLSYGINDEGMFKFARAAELAMGSEENHTGLSDDTYRIVKHTFTPETGFAYSFRIPEEKQGYVTSFEICAKAYGSPGSMVCYLIDARDLANFHSPAQAAVDYKAALDNKDDSFHFFAASKPYVLSSAYGRRYIRFDFQQEDETYPLMTQDGDEKVRYIAVIECLDCDKDNYYDIVFLQHKNSEGRLGDLELNNITYYYTRRSDGSTRSALTTDDEINASDMYYHIITRNVVENEVYPEAEGLYTFRVQTKNAVNKARVMLRIRKEGAWVTNTEDTKSKVYSSVIHIKNTEPNGGIKTIPNLQLLSQIYNPLELRMNDIDTSTQVYTVIGNNITKIHSLGEDTVTVEDPVLINDEDAIYRVGYFVTLKARHVSVQGNDLVATPYEHFMLPLTEVFKDFQTTDKEASARLIFESDLFYEEAGDEDYYNDFVIQVYWSNTQLNEAIDIRKAQMGAIKDIAVSFNPGY